MSHVKLQDAFINAVKRGDATKARYLLESVAKRADKIQLVNSTVTKTNSTPLFTAAWDGNVELCSVLIYAGAKVNWRNVRGNTAIMMAIECGHAKLVALLLQYGATATVNEARSIERRLQRDEGRKVAPEIISLIQNARALDTMDPSNMSDRNAQKFKELEVAILQSREKAVVEMLDQHQYRKLARAADSDGCTLLFTAASVGHVGLCRELLGCGAEINARDIDGQTALHMAIAGNHLPCVRFLLEQGASTLGVDVRDIRLWSNCNVSKGIDRVLKEFPQSAMVETEMCNPESMGLTKKQFDQQKRIFQYFDMDGDGLISYKELKKRLQETKRGPRLAPALLKEMIAAARSFNNRKGVSFSDFLKVLQQDVAPEEGSYMVSDDPQAKKRLQFALSDGLGSNTNSESKAVTIPQPTGELVLPSLVSGDRGVVSNDLFSHRIFREKVHRKDNTK